MEEDDEDPPGVPCSPSPGGCDEGPGADEERTGDVWTGTVVVGVDRPVSRVRDVAFRSEKVHTRSFLGVEDSSYLGWSESGVYSLTRSEGYRHGVCSRVQTEEVCSSIPSAPDRCERSLLVLSD